MLRPTRLAALTACALVLPLAVAFAAPAEDAATVRARLRAGPPAPPPLPHPDLAGAVPPPSKDLRDPRVPDAQEARFAAKVDGLFQRLLATPALKDPHGFAINRGIVVAQQQNGLPAWGPSIAQGNLLLRTVRLDGGSKPAPSGGYTGAGEGPSIKLSVNDISALFQYPQDHSDARPGFQDLAVKTETRDGFLVLRFRMHDHVVITKPGKKPYRHVTKQEVLELEIADRAAEIAQWGADVHKNFLDDQAKQKAELAALSPAQRAEPACLNGSRKQGTFARCDDVSAHYVVAFNPDYLDRSLPKDSIQLVILSEPIDTRDDDKQMGPIARKAMSQLDLRAIQQSLD